MEQLRQRVIASCHLSPLDVDEVREYIEHRLALVGWQSDPTFTDDAFTAIHAHTGGVPRRVNNLCSRLLLYGGLEEIHHFDAEVIATVARELAQEGTQHSSFRSATDVQPSVTPAAPPHAPTAPPVSTPASPPVSLPAPQPMAARPIAPEPVVEPMTLPPGHEETVLDLKQRVRILRGRR